MGNREGGQRKGAGTEKEEREVKREKERVKEREF